MNGVIEEIYRSRYVEDAEGRGLNPFPTSVSREVGEMLYHLVRGLDKPQTLEVGMAYGISSLFMCQALADGGGGHHTTIDPLERTKCNSIGLLNIERAGLSEYLTYLESPSHEALPRLRSDGKLFDLIFIDGSHLFDFVLIDFFYADLLLRPGGCLVLDDLWMPAVRKVVSFALKNRRYSIAPGPVTAPAPWSRRLARLARNFWQQPVDIYGNYAGLRMVFQGWIDCVVLLKAELQDTRNWNHYEPF